MTDTVIEGMMKLLVVIVNYKVAHLTIDCLHSVAAEIDSVPGMRVAVCENGTEDDSAARIQKVIEENNWGTWCTLTAIKPNLGFTGGNNVIIRPALQWPTPPEYVLLLNADTVVKANAFKRLVDFMDDHAGVGIAGSRLEGLNGAIQRSAFRFPSPLSEFESGIQLGLVSKLLTNSLVAPPPPSRERQVDWVSGASMIIRRQVLIDIGLLDEGLYTYFDDVDFCFNARKVGWQTWYVPTSHVVHLEGQTTGVAHQNLKRRPAYLFEARRRYFLKNHGPFYTMMADAGKILGLLLWRLRVICGKPDNSPRYFLADQVKHSVFLTGFAVQNVQNPTLTTGEKRS